MEKIIHPKESRKEKGGGMAEAREWKALGDHFAKYVSNPKLIPRLYLKTLNA